jgi:hypothetical protein
MDKYVHRGKRVLCYSELEATMITSVYWQFRFAL